MVHIEQEVKLDFKDVLIRPKRSALSSRSQVTLRRHFSFKHAKYDWTGVPIIASNMDTTGTFEMAKAFAKSELLVAVHKHYTVEEWKAFAEEVGEEVMNNVMVSTGISVADLEKTAKVVEVSKAKWICLDVANGYSEAFVQAVRDLRQAHPEHIILAGNVVTGEMAEQLVLSGADIVKVGIGPGSVCTTRKQTGVGYPQVSAIIECADAAHGLGGKVVGDGGCVCPGDVCKAFACGGDFVMLGGMLAGHDESGGELIQDEETGKYYKTFYGMSSDTAMKRYAGGVANYRSSEGKTVRVPYRGPIEDTVKDLLGGLRSCCTYVGASVLKELPRRTTFVRVTQQLNQIFGDATKTDAKPH